MIDLANFNSVFAFDPAHHYAHSEVADIGSHRRTFQTLFFDRLLQVLNVKVSHQQYPPRTNKDLRELHRLIVTAPIADHHKQSLLFYVLKDCEAKHNLSVAEDFASKAQLPVRYRTVIEGFWHLDRAQFQESLAFLTQPSLLPTFPEEVLATLLTHCKDTDTTLPLAYYHTVSPPLTHPETIRAFFAYLARASITEAFYFLRSRPSDMHHELLDSLIHATLSSHTEQSRADRGVELIDLPFTPEEEAWFEEYLLTGQGRHLHAASDTVMMRRIATGRLQDVVAEGKTLAGRKHDGVNWESLKGGLARGMGPRSKQI